MPLNQNKRISHHWSWDVSSGSVLIKKFWCQARARVAYVRYRAILSHSHKDEALKNQSVKPSEQSGAPGHHPRMARPQNRPGYGMGERDRRTLEFGGRYSAVGQRRFHRFGVLPRNRNETRDGAARIRRSARNSSNPAVCGLERIDLQQASSGAQGNGFPVTNGIHRGRGVYERRPGDQGGNCGTDAAEKGKRREEQGQGSLCRVC